MELDFDKLTYTEKVVLNALLTAGIVFLSSLTITGLPSIENIWAAFVGAGLSLLTQLVGYINRPPIKPRFGAFV